MLPLLASMLPTGLVGSGLTVNELWLTLKRDARHLTKEDRFLVKASVEVLLSKASLAERAERAFGSNVRWDLVERAPATEALYDTLTHGQPQAQTIGLAGVKGYEKLLARLSADAGPLINHINTHLPVQRHDA